MKKTVFGLLLVLSICLAGCAKTPEPTPTPTPGSAVEDQLAVLAEKLGTLENEIDWLSYEAGAQYAVTDLDGNGLLELVVSSMQGTGLFTTSYYYEVNEDSTGVTEWVQDIGESGSEPDIGMNEVPVYVDDNGVRHYLFDDYIRIGYEENWIGKYDVTYESGQVTAKLLAGCTNVYQEEAGEFEATCTDADNNEITEEAYNAIADTVFSGMEKKTAHIGWASYGDWAASPTVDTLAQSYAAFSVE